MEKLYITTPYSNEDIEYDGYPIYYKYDGRYGYLIASSDNVLFIYADCDGQLSYDVIDDYILISK